MNASHETIKDKSPYRRGADDGIPMGLLLIALFFSMTLAPRSPFAALITVILALAGVPVTTFLMLRKSYRRDNSLTLFSSLWMQGIVMFFCATLLLAMFEYLYMRFINPSFMENVFLQAADFYSSSATEQGSGMADMLHTMIDRHLIPGPINIAVETIWVGVFTGSVLSAIMAAVVRMKIWKTF